jgi:nitronate monooxygenase
MFSTRLSQLLGIEYPIVQSGMGGVAGPELAAEVSNAGGLGVLAGTLIPPGALREAIRQVRSLTDRPFGVNLLLLPELRAPVSTELLDDGAVAAVHAVLDVMRDRLGLPARGDRPPTAPDLMAASVEVLLDERVPVFSAGLGDPGPELNQRFHDVGAQVMVMVTNSADARLVEASGADVVVAQGLEAGGHRSHFVKPSRPLDNDLGTMALLPEVVDAVRVPVVAAGGITDGRGLAAALALGGSGVLMGSRFLVTRESTAPEAHKKRILEERGQSTVVTDSFTGRYARVLRNRYTEAFAAGDAPPALPFPSQYLVNADVRAAAERGDDAEFLPLWCGQAAGQLNDLPWASAVITDTIAQARRLITNHPTVTLD